MTEKLEALRKDRGLEFFANDAPKCPHCGEDFDITRNEAWFLFDENDTHTVECFRCENPFLVKSSATWRFSTDEQEEVE